MNSTHPTHKASTTMAKLPTLALLLLTSCIASGGYYPPPKALTQLQNGMTIPQVIAICGTPQGQIQDGNTTKLQWAQIAAGLGTKTKFRQLNLLFVDGKLTHYSPPPPR